MQRMLRTPKILSRYFYASPKAEGVPFAFSFVEHRLPALDFTETPVPVSFSPTEALYFQEPEKVKECRFVYTRIWAEAEQEILFSTVSHSKYKIWLNGRYVGACTGFDLFTFYLTLQPGENTLVFEVNLANPNYYDFNNRVVLRAVEEKDPHSFLCGTCLEYEKWIQFFQTPDSRHSDCVCIFVPRNYGMISAARVSVQDDFGQVLSTAPARPGLPVTFPTQELKAKSPQTVRFHLLLEVDFTDGTSTTRNQIVLVNDYGAEKAALFRRWQAARESCDPYIRDFLYYEYKRFFEKETSPNQGEAAALYQLDKRLTQIEEGASPYYLTEKNTVIYYPSAYDTQMRKIRICKPPRLGTGLPGLVVFVNPTGNSLGAKVAHLLKEREDLILIDLAVAGFSTGTPVSEALISEALAEVKKLYPYDERRIYWYGYCNSGSAVWSFCQNHPHLAARIVSVEAAPDPKRLENLEHCRCISYHWAQEPGQRSAAFPRGGDNRVFSIRNTTHNFMQYYLYRAENFGDLDYRLPEFPEKISFSTERGRFNQSFWITLNTIRAEQSRAWVNGKIVDRKTLRLRLHHCDDFSISVPPQTEKEFTVEINGVSISCKKAESLRFVRKKGRFCLAEGLPQAGSRKGTGLLDVYYGPLRIVHDGSEVACAVAQKFAHPETMSFSPKLQVSFPVSSVTDFPVEESRRNLVLVNVDTLCGQNIPLPVTLSEDGYRTEDEVYRGKYCILQVLPNPFDGKSSILHIGSNDLATFRNHLFLRKTVLPSMLTGRSPYWNARALRITEAGVAVLYQE